jgi:hypothetical protein
VGSARTSLKADRDLKIGSATTLGEYYDAPGHLNVQVIMQLGGRERLISICADLRHFSASLPPPWRTGASQRTGFTLRFSVLNHR